MAALLVRAGEEDVVVPVGVTVLLDPPPVLLSTEGAGAIRIFDF